MAGMKNDATTHKNIMIIVFHDKSSGLQKLAKKVVADKAGR